MKRRFVKRPSITAATKAIKSATANDMIDTFEERLAELSVETSTDVMSSTECGDRCVNISDTDYQYHYEDVEGGFGEPGAIYSLAEIKEFWNRENMNDPVLAEYTDYQHWWNDTLSNFMRLAD